MEEKNREVEEEAGKLLAQLRQEHQNLEKELGALRLKRNEVEQEFKAASFKNENQDRNYSQIESRLVEKKKEMVELVQRRQELAAGLDCKALRKVDIQRKLSKAHDIFKWCLSFLYGQNLFNYFFYNFMDEAIADSADFKERLAKVSPFKVPSETLELTKEVFEHRDKYLALDELKEHPEVAKLFEVAGLVLQLNNKLKELQAIKEAAAEFKDSTKEDSAQFERLKNEMDSLGRLQKVLQTGMKQLQSIGEGVLVQRECRGRTGAKGLGRGGEWGLLSEEAAKRRAGQLMQ